MEYLAKIVKKAAKTGPALAAASIRKELQAKFPGIKFQVKTRRFSMGDAVDIRWDFGPTTEEVDAIGEKYEQGSFDGMTDTYEYSRSPEKRQFQEQFGSAKYVHSQRSYGDTSGRDWFDASIYGTIGRALCLQQGVEYQGEYTRNLYGTGDINPLSRWVGQILARTSFPPGWSYQGLARYDAEYYLLGATNLPKGAISLQHPFADKEFEKTLVETPEEPVLPEAIPESPEYEEDLEYLQVGPNRTKFE